MNTCANGTTALCATNAGCPANQTCNIANGQTTGTCR
jgi:hypothetical protein